MNYLVIEADGQRAAHNRHIVTRIEPDDRILLVAGLNSLNHDQAIGFVLKAIVGLSHLESSKMLGIPYRVVRYRYHQAISRLKEFLSNHDDDTI